VARRVAKHGDVCGDDWGGRVRGDGPVDDCELVVAELPKKMEIGKMKGQRNSGIAVWTAFGVQIVVAAVCTVIILAGRLLGNPWIPAMAFTGLTAAAAGGYVASLGALSRPGGREEGTVD